MADVHFKLVFSVEVPRKEGDDPLIEIVEKSQVRLVIQGSEWCQLTEMQRAKWVEEICHGAARSVAAAIAAPVAAHVQQAMLR